MACSHRLKLGAMRPAGVLLILLLLPDGLVAQVSWDREIERVKALQEEMTRKADSLGADLYLGTMYNELDIPQHECSILGRMVGKAEVVAHLEKTLPERSESGFEFRLAARSLWNWLHTVDRLLKMPHDRRVRAWNLDCVGSMGIPVSARIAEQSAEAFYDVHGEEHLLHILGPVTEGFYNRLVAALDANPAVTTVALGSGGGLVWEAMLAGLEIRRRGLNTTLWNNCYSACPLVFIGGVERTIWSPYPRLGFHQVSNAETGAVPTSDPIYVRIGRYATRMGVDGRVLLRLMAAASPDSIAYAHPEELCEAGIATWVQRWCSMPRSREP